jgi:hypothetical protein
MPAMKNQNADPVDRDPVELFTAMAIEVGLLREGDKLDQNVIDLCSRAVGLAADIGDRYPNPENPEDTIGDIIRAELYA